MPYTIYDAAADGDISEVKSMLAINNSLINEADGIGWTPLHYAAAGNHYELTEFLIKNGAEINKKSRADGKTPLHWSAFYGHMPIIQLLVTSGAAINEKDDDGFTPLGIAMQTELRNIIHFLEDNGAIK